MLPVEPLLLNVGGCSARGEPGRLTPFTSLSLLSGVGKLKQPSLKDAIKPRKWDKVSRFKQVGP